MYIILIIIILKIMKFSRSCKFIWFICNEIVVKYSIIKTETYKLNNQLQANLNLFYWKIA